MNRYAVSGVTVATAATADNAIAGLWNPSTTKKIFVKEIHLFKTVAGTTDDRVRIRRGSARGTQTTSFTPGIEHDYAHQLAPESGAVYDTAWSAQPTFSGTAGKGLATSEIPNASGSGIMWVLEEPIAVKSANGLYIVTGTAAIFPISEVTFIWLE
jgi:hypothetical protein